MIDYRKTTSGDIVSMLLNIYDTKEVFVKELQVILAEKLLSSKEYDVEREVTPNPPGYTELKNRPVTSR